MADDEPVLLAHGEGIATLTLNRPRRLNAASAEMMQGLERQLRAVARIPGLRAVILTGAGRAFCAGGDLVEFRAALAAGGTRLIDTLRYNQGVIAMVEDLPVPVIGAANGTAVAGGLELLLCCDLVVAAPDARLGDGHTRYGIVPAGGATVRLVERIGPARAAQLFYTAETVDAQTALGWGLVNAVAPAGRLMEQARDLARRICAASPQANRHVKALTGRTARRPDRQARLDAELERFERHLRGGDLAEGLEAFATKRPPIYGAE